MAERQLPKLRRVPRASPRQWLLGNSAMLGEVGKGGFGGLGIRNGYQRFVSKIMLAVVENVKPNLLSTS
jgi:hypothetical protein